MSETNDDPVLPGRLQRLRAELIEEDMPALGGAPDELAGLVELAYALRPPVHEGRVPTFGAVLVGERLDRSLLEIGNLDLDLIDVSGLDVQIVRRFADGVRTFVVRTSGSITQLLCFGRAMAREYDLVILRELLGGIILQRHSSGQVRSYGPSGVVRWDGAAWYHEAPIDTLASRIGPVVEQVPARELYMLLMFAVHELSPRRIGSTLVWRADSDQPPAAGWEPRYPRVPFASLAQPGGPAAIASALAQTDGAALFDRDCSLVALGVQLLSSDEAKAAIDVVAGTRHTSAMRYSYDDPEAFVLVVSDAGPVTLMHGGNAMSLSDDPGERLIG